jgi:hypothetical protein
MIGEIRSFSTNFRPVFSKIRSDQRIPGNITIIKETTTNNMVKVG